MLGLCVTLKMFCMTLVITFVTLKNSPSWLKCVWCLSDCFYQSSHCIFSHQNLRCEMWFLGKFCSTLVIAFITLESFLTMLRVATLYHFVCFFLYNTPPGAKLGLCRSTIYPKFLISHQIFHFCLWFWTCSERYWAIWQTGQQRSTGKITKIRALDGRFSTNAV